MEFLVDEPRDLDTDAPLKKQKHLSYFAENQNTDVYV
jgi:hypothetical protein